MTGVYLFDTEATNRREGEIIEAAWVRVRAGKDLFGVDPDLIPRPLDVEDLFVQRFKPEKPTTFGSLAVHHILPSELEKCEPSSSFLLPFDTEYLIGHSIDYDWTLAGAPPHVKRICTDAMARHTWPDADVYGQVALIYMLLGPTAETRVLVRDAHKAAVDVLLNMRLLSRILDEHPEIDRWSKLWEFSESCRIPLKCPLKRWDGVKLVDMDDSAISWCLNQHWLDPYFRVGLLKVLADRYPLRRPSVDYDDDDDQTDDAVVDADPAPASSTAAAAPDLDPDDIPF